MRILLFIIFVSALMLTTCESPTSPNRDKEKIEIRNNDGLR